jgi:ATPase family protein associated with various cellular activities (AAA)
MFPGGISGKLGNRFEAKWTVQKLIEVFFGDAESIRFESINPKDHGVEFCLARHSKIEWHQTKKWETNGNWTVNRLEREGVLQTIIGKLSSSDNHWFFFVSEAPARGLHELPGKAEISQNWQEFDNGLSEYEREELTALNKIWTVNTEKTWKYLKRCRFEVVSETSLDTQIQLLAGLAFNEPTEVAFPILRAYLESNLNRELKTEDLRKELIEDGRLTPRAPFDSTLRERVVQATQRYLDSYYPFGAGGDTIPRAEAVEAINHLIKEDSSTIVLLTGSAGSGKSGVVRQILARLSELDVSHIAFRVDRYLANQSIKNLGQMLVGRQEDPIVSLASLDRHKASVIIIDQVDAISEASGRVGPMRDIVFELIRTAEAAGNIRVLVVCRSFDLTNDRTLRDLDQRKMVFRIEVKQLDWTKEVEPLLVSKGVDTVKISATQRSLLTLPLNLSLFIEVLSSKNAAVTFSSTSDLYDLLVDRKQRAIRERGYHDLSVAKVIATIAKSMSDNQLLDAPCGVLDAFPNALDLLEGENLIIRGDNRIFFFHESFFDYAFARSFVVENQRLLTLLRSDEQFLFRRTQVRQILTAYRQSGSATRYLAELRDVLVSDDVRYHLKDGVVRWAGTLDDATESELDIFLSLDKQDERMPSLVSMVLYPQINWFPILHRRNLFVIWLQSSNEDRRRAALNILRNGAKKFPSEVAGILRDWWQKDGSRETELLQWFAWLGDVPPTQELLSLLKDLIRSKPPVLFNKRHFDMHPIAPWFKKNPLAASEILKVWFESWFELFPEGHPFKKDGLNDISSHWLQELQKKSSVAFLDAAIPIFVETIRRINQSFDGKTWTDWTWQTRRIGKSYGADDFFALIRSALEQVAKIDTEKAKGYLLSIDPASHPAALHLYLETIASNGEGLHELLTPLLNQPGILDAGPMGADWLSFSRAVKAALPSLSETAKGIIETRVLNHWDELDYAIKTTHRLSNGQQENEFTNRQLIIRYLNWNGYQQWCILKTIGTENLSVRAYERLKLLERKFRGESIASPSEIKGGFVPPPLGKDAAKFMTDEQWLKALHTYKGEYLLSRRKGSRNFHSGASGLAQVLQAQTKENPERFARLLLKLPLNIDQNYFEGILFGLCESSADKATLIEAILYVHARPDRLLCGGISRVIDRNPNLAEDERIFEILVWYVENGNATTQGHDDAEIRRLEQEIIKVEHLTRAGGGVQIRSDYGDRGSAAETLGRVLWECPSRLQDGISVLRRRIENEPLQSIRCCLTQAIYSVLRYDNNQAADLLRRLVVRADGIKLAPLSTWNGLNALFYILHGSPEIGRELLEYLLQSDNESYRLVGVFHLLREAFYSPDLVDRADRLIKTSEIYRKLAADAAANHFPSSEYRVRAEAQLIDFFNDPSKDVRAEAADCFRYMEHDKLGSYRYVLRSYIYSRAFEEQNFSFFLLLQEAHDTTFEEVVLASERILDLTEKELNQGTVRQFTEAHYLDELIRREYAAVADKPNLRKRLLDVIDKMLKLGFYGTDQIIREHERL